MGDRTPRDSATRGDGIKLASVGHRGPHRTSPEGTGRSLTDLGSHHHQAAVDGEDLAGDVGGLVRGEERDGVGDLLGRPEAAERRARR